MHKLLPVILIVLLVGWICKEGHSQSLAMDDSTAIKGMLDDLQQLKESNLEAAFEMCKTIAQKASKVNYQKGVWEARIEQGKLYSALGYTDSSLTTISQVLQETRQQNDRITQIKAHLGLADAFQQDLKFQSCIDHLIQAEKLLKKDDPFDLRFDILNRQGITHRLMKDYTNALKYYKIIGEVYSEQLSTKQKFFLYMNQGNVFVEQKDYAKTEALFKKAYEEIRKVNSPDNQALITYNLGALFYRQKRYPEARQYIDKAIQAIQSIGDQTKLERCYRVLGAICYDQKDYLKARDYYNTALKIALSIKNPNAIMGNYKNLYLTYWDFGYYNKNIQDLDKALGYYQKYAKFKDSIYQIETTAKVLEMEKQYETEKKNSQIALLEKENQHQQDQILMEHTRRKSMILVIVLVSATLVLFAYFVYYYKRSNQLLHAQSKSILEQKNQIAEQNLQLQKLLNTQNRLFSIIAHDLRSPLVSLYNISSIIEYHIEDKEYEALGKTAQKMNHKITKILGLTDNLLSWAHSQRKNTDLLLMPLSIREIIEECLEIYRPIAADKQITIDYLQQKDELVWADRNRVKTICRNLINNAVKFTPNNGSIYLWHKPQEDFISICVKDSGVGIAKEKLEGLFDISQEKISTDTSGEKSSGLGLSICKEFAQSMKGTIKVESQVGIGSQFSLELLAYNPQIHQPAPQQPKQPIKSSVVSTS
ncbi:MAG: ATP-binding protein [Methylococcaceae bacterium]|nr:tetratricopeptide repeat-containing sensor histidine kinase [Prolixibacteraceae bacterium]